MKLLYTLNQPQSDALALRSGESLLYCVPVDLQYDHAARLAGQNYVADAFLAVTQSRLAVLAGNRVEAEFALCDCEKIKCEHQVNCGIVTVTKKGGEQICAVRFSMRHITRVSYAVRGAQEIINALEKGKSADDAEAVQSFEYEKYCEKCGRALPGTSKCPYCEGKKDLGKKFLDLCGDSIGKLLAISGLMVGGALINLLIPVVQRNFIDQALANGAGSMEDLFRFVGITFVLLACLVFLDGFRYWKCVKLGTELSMNLRRRLYYKIQTLSLSFINVRKPGELLNRVSRDTNQIRAFMEEVFGDMVAVLLTMLMALGMMFAINWKMTLMSMVFIVLVFVITKAFWHKIHTIYHKQWLKADDLSSNLQDIISGMRIVKSFGQEEREAGRFTKKTKEFAALSKRNETFWAIFFPIMTFLIGAGTYVAIWMGSVHVLEGDMTLGELVQFVTYCGYLYGPLGWMTHLPRAVMQMITSLNRIYDVLDEEPKLADRENCVEFPIEGAFTFEEVSFGYQTYEPVLENVSFTVKPGEMIGLVGASGTGKSTLINLIMRLYDVDHGRITIDGVDIRSMKAESLHSQIGVVLQETFLFSGSILDNIRFARQDATLLEVIQAARAANAHDFICKTPDGYNTYVGEHGYSLSGGERQRIAIARAILNNPRLLILDEATSALDTESEFLIQQALNRLVKGRTTFAIAHRLSTLRNADRLVVIDKHGVAEIGTHNELLERKGIYYNLVNAQLRMAEGE